MIFLFRKDQKEGKILLDDLDELEEKTTNADKTKDIKRRARKPLSPHFSKFGSFSPPLSRCPFPSTCPHVQGSDVSAASMLFLV